MRLAKGAISWILISCFFTFFVFILYLFLDGFVGCRDLYQAKNFAGGMIDSLDRAAAFFHLEEHQMVPQACGNRFYLPVGRPVVEFASFSQAFPHIVISGRRCGLELRR